MTIEFSNAGLRGFLALAAVPLLLHLFARARPPSYRFSSVEFIRRILRKTTRIRRPKDWILLALRTALFAAVLLLFLDPVAFFQGRLGGASGRRSVVVVVDSSASMACLEGGQTRFAAACAQASDILAGLSVRDTANLVWLNASPAAVFPEMGVNAAYLRALLRRATVTQEAGNASEALRVAAEQLRRADGRREAYLVSDFQRTTWNGASAALPRDTQTVIVRVGRTDPGNQAVTDIVIAPPSPLAGEEADIGCEVWNYSDGPQRKTVYLNVQERRASQELIVPPWSKATAVFRHRFAAAGVVPLAASLNEDAFPADDCRRRLVEVRPYLRVGILPGDRPAATAWKRAADALGWVRAEWITPEDLAGDAAFDACLLAGWNGVESAALRRRLDQGCAAVWYPAPDTPAAAAVALAGTAAVPADAAVLRRDKTDTARRVRLAKPDDALFRVFGNGEYGNPARAWFRARLDLAAAALPPADLLMAYEDGTPALMRFRRRGPLYLWNLPLGPERSNWPGQFEFLVLMGELLQTGGSGGSAAGTSAERLPGQTLAWLASYDTAPADIVLRDELGRPVPIQPHRGEAGIQFVTPPMPAPGVYTWSRQEQTIGRDVINFPAVESDLRALPPRDTDRMGTATVGAGQSVRRLHEGTRLWPYLLAAAVVLAIVELAGAAWMEKT